MKTRSENHPSPDVQPASAETKQVSAHQESVSGDIRETLTGPDISGESEEVKALVGPDISGELEEMKVLTGPDISGEAEEMKMLNGPDISGEPEEIEALTGPDISGESEEVLEEIDDKKIATLEQKLLAILTLPTFDDPSLVHFEKFEAHLMEKVPSLLASCEDDTFREALLKKTEAKIRELHKEWKSIFEKQSDATFKNATNNILATTLNAHDLKNADYRSSGALAAAMLKRWEAILNTVTDPASRELLETVAREHSQSLHGEWLAHAEKQWTLTQGGIHQLLVVSDKEAADPEFLDLKTFIPAMRKRVEPAFSFVSYDPFMIASAHRFAEQCIIDFQKTLKPTETKAEKNAKTIDSPVVIDNVVEGKEEAIEEVKDTTKTNLTAKEIVQTAKEVDAGQWAKSMTLTEVIHGKTWTDELKRDATDAQRGDLRGGSGVQRGETGRNVSKTLIQTTGQLDRGEFQEFKEGVKSSDITEEMGHGAAVMTNLFEYGETRRILNRRDTTIEEDLEPAVKRILHTTPDRVRDSVSRGELRDTDIDDYTDNEADDRKSIAGEDDDFHDGGTVFDNVLQKRQKEKERQEFLQSNLAA